MKASPSFTIALPVRNGGAYLPQCVESILAQTHGDFTLAILDNASTDATPDYLASLRDARVRLYPAARPLSIEENWARIKTLPDKAEFLTTIGHDDLLDAHFLDTIKRLINAHPDAGLYLTHFRLIDEHGTFLRHCRPMPERETAAEFVAARLCVQRDSFGTGHVLRSAVYDALGGIPPYRKLLHADDALFVQAIGGSYRATALEETFSYRWHVASAGGGCTIEEFCVGLEPYADLLADLSTRDSVLASVLRRWFASSAIHWGRRWRREALLTAYRAGVAMPPEIDRRIHRLVTRFDDAPDLPPEREPFESRLLERAPRSRVARALYAGLDAARRSRALAARWAHRRK